VVGSLFLSGKILGKLEANGRAEKDRHTRDWIKSTAVYPRGRESSRQLLSAGSDCAGTAGGWVPAWDLV